MTNEEIAQVQQTEICNTIINTMRAANTIMRTTVLMVINTAQECKNLEEFVGRMRKLVDGPVADKPIHPIQRQP